jgi:glycosyltransferase involved in cell wall biosynthesis
MILSICIPTYNRAKYLNNCLKNLLPQVLNFKDEVEIIIIDNNSTDETNSIVKIYTKEYPYIKYQKNDFNLGYTGNQILAYTLPMGFYTAFLSDDDVYLDTLIYRLLPILYLKKYSFVALNYFSFKKNIYEIFQTNFAPTNNVEFKRAYDILNYPSVGHWSGFIINTELAKMTLSDVRKLKTPEEFEKNRGLIGEIIHRALSKSIEPSFFFGQRLLAVNVPEVVDYDVFNHLYIDDYKFYMQLYEGKYINESDLIYRKKLIFSKINKSILTQSFKYSKNELLDIIISLDSLFGDDRYYVNNIRPFFQIVNYQPIRFFLKFIYLIYKKFKS